MSGTADKDICERGKMVDCNGLVLNGFKLFELTTRLSITPHLHDMREYLSLYDKLENLWLSFCRKNCGKPSCYLSNQGSLFRKLLVCHDLKRSTYD